MKKENAQAFTEKVVKFIDNKAVAYDPTVDQAWAILQYIVKDKAAFRWTMENFYHPNDAKKVLKFLSSFEEDFNVSRKQYDAARKKRTERDESEERQWKLDKQRKGK